MTAAMGAEARVYGTRDARSKKKGVGMAGLRMGGVVASKPLVDVLKNAVVNDLGVNIVAQYGAIHCYFNTSSFIIVLYI